MKKNSIDLFIYLLKNRGYLSDVDVAEVKAMHKEETIKLYYVNSVCENTGLRTDLIKNQRKIFNFCFWWLVQKCNKILKNGKKLFLALMLKNLLQRWSCSCIGIILARLIFSFFRLARIPNTTFHESFGRISVDLSPLISILNCLDLNHGGFDSVQLQFDLKSNKLFKMTFANRRDSYFLARWIQTKLLSPLA